MAGKLFNIFIIGVVLATGIYSFHYLDYVRKMNPQILISALTNEEPVDEEGFHGGDRPFSDGGGGHRSEGNIPGGGFHKDEEGSNLSGSLNEILASAGVFAFAVTLTHLLDRKQVKKKSSLPETVS